MVTTLQNKCKILYDLDEIKQNNYKIKASIPLEKKCPYCNKVLEVKGILNLKDNCIYTFIQNDKCNCAKSVEERNKAQQELILKETAEFEKLRKDMINKKIKQYYGTEFITENFKTKTLDSFIVNNENKKTKLAAQKFINNFTEMKKGIMFVGNNGTGKTHISIAIANELMKQNVPVIFGTLSDLLDKYNDNNNIELTKLYAKVDLLIIDDLGVEYMNDWMLSKLFVIINERINNGLPIIITTNYNIEELKERLQVKSKINRTTDSIISRLFYVCCKVDCKGKDYRIYKI